MTGTAHDVSLQEDDHHRSVTLFMISMRRGMVTLRLLNIGLGGFANPERWGVRSGEGMADRDTRCQTGGGCGEQQSRPGRAKQWIDHGGTGRTRGR